MMVKKLLYKHKITLLILAIVIFLFLLYFFSTEMGQRFALYHNYIDVVVDVDGYPLNLSGTKVNYIFEGDIIEKRYFKTGDNKKKNHVRFRKGLYGPNKFEFVISKELLNKFKNDIKISFGQFNTNWWHKNKYSVNISIHQLSSCQADVTILQKVSCITDGGGEINHSDEINKRININSNTVEILVGP